MEGIHDNVTKMLITVNATDHDVENLQTRLSAAFDDLQRPMIRIADGVSDLHDVLKGNDSKAERPNSPG